MSLSFRFAIVSDLHIALPHTIPDHVTRFHRTELSISIFEQVLDHLAQLDLDFLLLPGDLTQDGEPDNHQWLSDRLSTLSYPVYVVPGNHDFLTRDGSDRSIAVADFHRYYAKFGCADPDRLYYRCAVLPGVSLIGLNSIFFNEQGQQTHAGRLDAAQMDWLRLELEQCHQDLVLVMIHHNVIEHMPGQATSPLGRRYMLENAPELIALLQEFGVQLVFTGHLHVQDVAQIDQGCDRLYDITTGSLVSYPHPYRILHYSQDESGQGHLQFESQRVKTAPGWPDLQTLSREFIAERSQPFMLRLLTDQPLGLSEQEAVQLVPHLRYFWADIAGGDAQFCFPQFPPAVRSHFERFSDVERVDNAGILDISGTFPRR